MNMFGMPLGSAPPGIGDRGANSKAPASGYTFNSHPPRQYGQPPRDAAAYAPPQSLGGMGAPMFSGGQAGRSLLQPAYRPAVPQPRPTEMGAPTDFAALASMFDQLCLPAVAVERGQDLQPTSAIPNRQRLEAPTYVQPVSQRIPPAAQMSTTHPEAQLTRFLRTDLATYEVIKSIDPRGDKPLHTGMGSGIYLIRDTKTGRPFVEKRITIKRKDQQERALAESDALFQIYNAGFSYSINMIIEEFWDGATNYCSLILEYCDDGTVADVIQRYRNDKQPIPEPFVWHVLAGLTKALCFMHEGLDLDRPYDPPFPKWNTICNLDIKPANVFLSTKNQRGPFSWVVLGDFGCAVTWKDIKSGRSDRAVQWHGTPGWSPPEHHLDANGGGIQGRYGMPTDVWQMGGAIQAMCRLDELNGIVCGMMHREYLKRPKALNMVGEVKRQMKKRALAF
ncbi:hypothetical protein LTR85_001163 [Meristemomyces frigidus]|nr:hypothetical protein LTR85_001163 [Meristemomyces frigidus]